MRFAKIPSLLPAAALLLLCTSGAAQNIITTYAGTDWQFPADGKRALDAPLGGALGLTVAVDSKNNYFIADPDNRLVLKVDSDGKIQVVAGNGILGYSGDGGLATNASIATIRGIAIDGQDNLYIAEYSKVRRVDAQGIITTVAGAVEHGFADGPGANARFDYIFGIAADRAGNLFVTDQNNHRLRKITPDGNVVTIAGNGKTDYPEDGAALSTSINTPYGVTVDPEGNVWFTDVTPVIPQLGYGLGLLRAITPEGKIVTVLADNPVLPAFVGPIGLASDKAGNIYFGSQVRSSVYRIGTDGSVGLVAGQNLEFAGTGFSGDGGPGNKARLNLTHGGLAVDSGGSVYIADNYNTRIRKVTPDGIIHTVAGSGRFRLSSNLPATSTALYAPMAIAFDPSGSLYVAEPFLNRIRKISAGGVSTDFAGNGEASFAGDNGPATSASFFWPFGVAADRNGNVYIADSLNRRVRRVSPDGGIATFAGGGSSAYGIGDNGPATAAFLHGPQRVAVDASGNVYIAEYNGNRIRKVTPGGTITTIAGTGQSGYSGDNGPAVRATLSGPNGMAVDAAGNLYFADTENNVVRRLSASGIISTVAGTGIGGYTGDNGPAVKATLRSPFGVALDQAGNLYIADSGNYVIRRVDVYGTIQTVAGTGNAGLNGDGGPATQATFTVPRDLAFDAAGNLYVADSFNDRVRVVLVNLPQFQTSPRSLGYTVVPGGSETATKNLYISGSVPGLPFSVAGNRKWLKFTPDSGVTPATVQVSVDPSNLGEDVSPATITVTAPSTVTVSQSSTVSLTLGTAAPGGIEVQSAALSFAIFEGTPAPPQTVTLVNASPGAAEFSAAPDVAAPWLKVTPATGGIGPRGQASLQVSVDPSLATGTYSGRVLITDIRDGSTQVLSVTATVSAVPQSISLSQSGLTFTAVENGSISAPQAVGIVNLGRGVMNWTAAATSLAGEKVSWIAVTPEAGSSDASAQSVPEIQVSVDNAGLAAGNYYAQVRITAPGADNSPQFLLVVLTVLPRGANPGPVVQPTSLIFNAPAGGGSPSSQTVTVSNLSAEATSFTSGRITSDGRNWFTHIPASGTVAAGGVARFVVQPFATGLAPGIYRGSLTMLFDGNVARTVNLVFIVSGASAAPRTPGRSSAEGCPPTKLVPIFTTLGTESLVPAGWPQRLVVRVFDDCGTPMVSGSVSAQFSGNIPPVFLTSLKDGNWSGTWQSRNDRSTSVTIKVKADRLNPQLTGTAEIVSNISPNQDPPVLDTGAILNTASRASDKPLSPGSLVTITGAKLAQTTSVSGGLPLPTSLAGTVVALGGRAMPLVDVADDHITAVVPYDVPVNTRLQLIVQRGNSAAVPENITMAPVQPAIFTQDKTGRGQGMIFKVNADGTTTLAAPGNAVAAGDTIQIQCTGLGAVDPAVSAGSPAPDIPLASVTTPVSVTIGEVKAEVTLAVLQPGSAGVYIVVATVPGGVPTGEAVPVIVTAGSQASPPATLAVK